MIHDRRIKLNRDFNFRSNCEQFLRMRNFSNPSIPIIESRSISHDRIVCFLKMIYICIRNYEITRRKNKQVPSLFISRSIKRYRDVTTQEEEGQLKSCSFKMMNGNRRRWSDRASILTLNQPLEKPSKDVLLDYFVEVSDLRWNEPPEGERSEARGKRITILLVS